MNRIYSCIIAFIALTLVSCMDERDEYGFYIEYRGIDRAKQFDANTNTLTIDLTGYWNENSELNGAECGFIVDGKEIPGNITGDHMTAQISQITLDEPHTVAMYCRNEGNELVSQTQTWQWSKEEFAPNPVEDLTLYINKKGEYQYSKLIYQRDSKLPLTAQVTIGNHSYDMTVTDSGNGYKLATMTFDPQEWQEGEYQSATVKASNTCGQNTRTTKTFLSITNNTEQYGGDGVKTDYIEGCGIGWAKGNLMYKNGSRTTGKTQFETLGVSKWDSNNTEFFQVGNINVSAPNYNTKIKLPSKDYYFRGDAAYDVATCRMGNAWQLPCKKDFITMMTKASAIYTQVSTESNGIVEGLFFMGPKAKRVVALRTKAVLSEDFVNKNGVFFPTRGYFDKYNSYPNLRETCIYMTSDYYYGNYNDYIENHYPFCYIYNFYTKDQNYLFEFNINDSDDWSYRYAVKAVFKDSYK